MKGIGFHLKVKFFAYYRDIFKCKQINIEKCTTVQEIIDYLCSSYGKKAVNIFYKDNEFSDEVIVLVNGDT